ncbi:MAG: tripartite tricarboxylate transporter substrate binding protein [Clostridia bacterium]
MKKYLKSLALLTAMIMMVSVVAVGCSQKAENTPAPAAEPKKEEVKKEEPKQEEAKKEVDWPKKPITFLVPAKAGGDTDFNARAYAKHLEKELGQSIGVVNIDGASGTLAVRKVKDSDPDGYNVLVYHTSMILNTLNGLIDFSFEAFEMGGIGAMESGNVIVVNKDSNYNSLKDLVEAAKANPKNIKLGIQQGGIYHMLGYMLQGTSDTEFNLVDAGGAADKNVALKGKKVDAIITAYGAVKGFVESGDFRVIAVASEKRNAKFSDVPTAKEQGFEILLEKPYYFLFPKGTPKEITEKFNKAINNVAANNKDYAAEIDKAYMLTPNAMNIEDSSKFMDDQFNMMKKYHDAYIKK